MPRAAGQHALSAEFARIADYLALMKVRMGERLQTRLVLPDELASLPVPPLLLQPLVENSIRHGLEPKVEGGRIELEASREGDLLVLRVRDTGVGPGRAVCRRHALRPAAGARAPGHAVRRRGQPAARSRRRRRGGTVATIRLPVAP